MSQKPSNPKDMVGVRKAPMSTVPAGVMLEVGLAMLEGMVKYGRHNYRIAGIRASVYYDATMRHLMAWWEGEDRDPDSAAMLSHITKAIASLTVLRDAMMQGMMTDDRPPQGHRFVARLNDEAGKIIDQHADKSPRHYTIKDPVNRPAEFPRPSGDVGRIQGAIIGDDRGPLFSVSLDAPPGVHCAKCPDDVDCHQRGLCIAQSIHPSLLDSRK